MKKLLLLLFLLVLILPSQIFASDIVDELNEDGFRKMKFGEPLNIKKYNMKLIVDKKDKEQNNP